MTPQMFQIFYGRIVPPEFLDSTPDDGKPVLEFGNTIPVGEPSDNKEALEKEAERLTQEKGNGIFLYYVAVAPRLPPTPAPVGRTAQAGPANDN